MIEFFQRKDILVRIFMGLVIFVLGGSMLIYLVPGTGGSDGGSPDAVATVAGRDITSTELSRQISQIERSGQPIPKSMRSLYVKDLLDRLINQHMLEYEAQRLGLRVTDQESAEQIRQILPTAFSGGSVSSLENYAAEVQQRTGMSVPEFEEALRTSLLQAKIHRLVTDGITATPAEIADEFKQRNEKAKLEYVVIKPSDLESRVEVSEASLSDFFEKNKGRYQIPERRSFQYALLDVAALRQTMRPSDAALESYYKQNLEQYRVQNRAHVEHILLKTTGKTDAEVAEIRKKAEDVLAKARKGAKFEDLAKQYSEDDSTKAKGGDLGWILKGQTVPEFEQAAFALKPGEISGLVKSMFGFHIIKMLEREEARTKSFEEVRASIVPILAAQMADEKAATLSDQMAAAVRQSSRAPLEDIARQFNLQLGTVPPVAASDPLGPLGVSNEVRDFLFSAQKGEDSTPIRLDRGTVIVRVTNVLPAHQAALAEVRTKVEADYRAQQSTGLARQRAEELAKRIQGGESLSGAAKALGLEVQTSDFLARNDTLAGLTQMRKLSGAYTLPVGQASPAVPLGMNWLVYRVAERQEPNPEDLAKQENELRRQIVQSKQQLAFEAFQDSLRQRLTREGKLKINDQVLRRLTGSS
jgi:peptidyl-prolyl cis-trans isomerase D